MRDIYFIDSSVWIDYFRHTDSAKGDLSDLLIATHCLEHRLVLIENDRHFAAIAEHLPLRLSTD